MSNAYREINTCEVCGNERLVPVLDLGAHPMCDDLVEIGSSRECKRYSIDILFCETCLTAHQRFQVPKQDLFPALYHYRSRFTADVLRGMQGLVQSCEERFGSLKGKKVLDVGCNDGSLLGFFAERGAVTIGIEPTGAATDATGKGHAVFNDFLSEECASGVGAAHGKMDLIAFTNVFAHIENLREVISSLRMLMAPHTVIVIENHYLGAVLNGNQFDTFYHEHPRTYSLRSFESIAQSLGTQVLSTEFPARYGGNIRVFLGQAGAGALPPGTDVDESDFLRKFGVLSSNVGRWQASKRRAIEDLVSKHGKLRAKAFPGRAAILVQLLGLDENHISAVHEKPGSMKIGHYLPGTRIPIHSDDELFALAPTEAPLLNMAWHISSEIRSYLAHGGYTGPVLDILEPQDFS